MWRLIGALVVVDAIHHDLALGTLSDLGGGDLTLDVYCLLDELEGILVDQHQLDDVKLLISTKFSSNSLSML